MIVWAILFLVVVLLFVQPWIEEQRERKLAERLKGVKDPLEAQIMLDREMRTRRGEIDFLNRIKETFFPFLFR
jgi:hypothetical protein